MFFLVTGASGVGKSTVRQRVAPRFRRTLVAAELATLGLTPQWSMGWRQQAVELAVQRALEAQQAGKHFLLCGDPVPPGELYAAPSADQLAGIAVCLLDAAPHAQRERLLARGDDPELLVHHLAFAAWMREHARDHRHRPEVLLQDRWEAMRWERWMRDDLDQPPWRAHVIDTTDCGPADVSIQVATWIRQVLSAGAQHRVV
jgi:hypothetical protein